MSEAEVILRLAMYYIKNNLTKDQVLLYIDGAHIKTKNEIHFDIFTFLKKKGFLKIDANTKKWQGEYVIDGFDSHVLISSKSGVGDVNIKLRDGRTIYAECKKSKNNKSGQEYQLMREAIGQLVTGCDFIDGVIPMVAIPLTDKSKELAERWAGLTQIKNLGIKFALVCENGEVEFY